MNEFLRQSRRAFRTLHGLELGQEVVAEEPGGTTGFDTARRHRVVGLWADSSDCPLIGEEWNRYACGQALYTARLTAEGARMVDVLRGSIEGLRIIKGPALEAQAWPHPGLRSYDDLDFRCTKSSLPALTVGMEGLGYRPGVEDDRRRENLWHFGWGIAFHHPAGYMVEFNHRMFPPHFPWPERLTRHATDLWVDQELEHFSVKAPVPALHFLLSSVHAIWHGWERLGWLVDIAGLLVRCPGVLTEAEQLASGNRFLRRSLHLACAVAEQIFGPLPNGSNPDEVDQPLMDQALALLMRDEAAVPVEVQRQIHHRLMRPHEAARYTLRRLSTPGDPDFRRVSLPVRLRGLYWVLRPFRHFGGKITRTFSRKGFAR